MQNNGSLQETPASEEHSSHENRDTDIEISTEFETFDFESGNK
ncbi:MAG: hypothetical protein OCD02_03085 [Spirochaetaceae bacterium]